MKLLIAVLILMCSAAPGFGAATVEGRWNMNANGFRGPMEFSHSGSHWTGRLSLDGAWESLGNIRFDSGTGVISFDRPRVRQHYTGRLSGNTMSGSFDNAYKWSAARVDAPPPPPPVGAIEGQWKMNANGFRGPMEFSHSGSHWTGRLSLDGAWESLGNIRFDSRTGVISFDRPRVRQHYTGRLSGNTMSGSFDNAYKWSAAR